MLGRFIGNVRALPVTTPSMRLATSSPDGKRVHLARLEALLELTHVVVGVLHVAGQPVVMDVPVLAVHISAGLMTPQVLAILRTSYSGQAQARAFSMFGLSLGIGAVSGQLIGGLLIGGASDSTGGPAS